MTHDMHGTHWPLEEEGWCTSGETAWPYVIQDIKLLPQSHRDHPLIIWPLHFISATHAIHSIPCNKTILVLAPLFTPYKKKCFAVTLRIAGTFGSGYETNLCVG